jgi:hypothetical protein
MTVFYAFVHYRIEGCCLPLLIMAAFNAALSVTTLILITLYLNAAMRARSSIWVSPLGTKKRSQKDEGSVDRLGNAFGIEFQDPERRAANSAGLTIFVPLNSGKGKCFLLPVTK